MSILLTTKTVDCLIGMSNMKVNDKTTYSQKIKHLQQNGLLSKDEKFHLDIVEKNIDKYEGEYDGELKISILKENSIKTKTQTIKLKIKKSGDMASAYIIKIKVDKDKNKYIGNEVGAKSYLFRRIL